MATYIYETIPESTGEKPERFEFQQSMMDDPLTEHPQTGIPVRRVITGGYGFNVSVSGKSAATPSSNSSGSCCAGSCDC
ncbi:MAG: zinc ribbon domain-containing protein [Verrucomicrobiota bacterium]